MQELKEILHHRHNVFPGLPEIGMLLPNKQRQRHPEGCAALHIVLVTVPRVSRSCEHFPDGFDTTPATRPVS